MSQTIRNVSQVFHLGLRDCGGEGRVVGFGVVILLSKHLVQHRQQAKAHGQKQAAPEPLKLAEVLLLAPLLQPNGDGTVKLAADQGSDRYSSSPERWREAQAMSLVRLSEQAACGGVGSDCSLEVLSQARFCL